MSGIHRYSRAVALALVFAALPFTEAFAHCFVGARFFPATLAVDDPCVADELSLPTISWSRTGDVPPATEWDVSAEISKRITPELAMLLGLIVDWGGTGASNSGIATPYSVFTPTYYFGKGFGDLPDEAGWLRAFAVTGQIGYQVPSRSFDLVQQAFIPQVLAWGGSIQYSMPYLKSEIQDLQLPDFINHLIPIVEFQMSTPAANNFGNSFVTTGTINPGVIWVGSYFQVGLEAQVPVNAQSGHGIGVLGQLHLYLDDMFPKTIGQPLIGGTSTAPQQLKF